MSEARITLLPDRSVIGVKGEDAEAFLQGLVTNDVLKLRQQSGLHTGLLSPQGKILFEFLIANDIPSAPADGEQKPTSFFLDVARDNTTALVKRLSLYKLRARVTVEDLSEKYRVLAVFGGDGPARIGNESRGHAALMLDPRSERLGVRLIVPSGLDTAALFQTQPTGLPELAAADGVGAYDALRISLAVPEGGKDYDLGDAFPHEADFDLLGGVSFDKGCYVGQEIVARMEHRGTVRKRVVHVMGMSDLPATRPDVMMGDVVIGKLGSVAGNQGLALLRLDRAIEALDKGVAVTADGIALQADPAMIARQRKLMADKAAQA